MKHIDIIKILDLILSIITVFLAYKIGSKQNKISEKISKIQDFAEIFLMPQTILGKDKNDNEIIFGYNLLIKNASTYSIYIDKYIFNSKEEFVGGSVLPTDSNNWYQIPIDISLKQFEIEVYFSDHIGRKYKTSGSGKFINDGWSIKSKKRQEVSIN